MSISLGLQNPYLLRKSLQGQEGFQNPLLQQGQDVPEVPPAQQIQPVEEANNSEQLSFREMGIRNEAISGRVAIQSGDSLHNVVKGIQDTQGTGQIDPSHAKDREKVMAELISANPQLANYIKEKGMSPEDLKPNQVDELMATDLKNAGFHQLQTTPREAQAKDAVQPLEKGGCKSCGGSGDKEALEKAEAKILQAEAATGNQSGGDASKPTELTAQARQLLSDAGSNPGAADKVNNLNQRASAVEDVSKTSEAAPSAQQDNKVNPIPSQDGSLNSTSVGFAANNGDPAAIQAMNNQMKFKFQFPGSIFAA